MIYVWATHRRKGGQGRGATRSMPQCRWQAKAAAVQTAASRHMWPNRDVVVDIWLVAFNRLEMRPSIIYLYTKWLGGGRHLEWHFTGSFRTYYTCTTATQKLRYQDSPRSYLFLDTHPYTPCYSISPPSEEKPAKIPAPLRVSEK
jgi:hypothetical protein